MRGRPKGTGRYSERHVYIMRVLFLYGLSRAEIARLMGIYGVHMTPAAVNGQIAAMGYRKKDMSREARQRFLDELAKDRQDRTGRLMAVPEHFFKAV